MNFHRQDNPLSKNKKLKEGRKKGLMIVLSAPSGGGKTTLTQKLLKRERNIIRSVSCTTRKPRKGERNGRDYFFISPARFKKMITKKAFLEWAKVYRNFYGTPRHWVEEQLKKGKDVLFVIDVQGGLAIRRKTKEALLIFLKPPSLGVLQKRLVGRLSEDPENLKVRLGDAKWEMNQGRHYDYQVVNNRLDKAVSRVEKIIEKERNLFHKDPNR